MPLMREWVEFTVDEDLLVPVVRELLDMAVDPNQVEVTHGAHGRILLVEVHLAEHWYQERLKRDGVVEEVPEDSGAAEVVEPLNVVAATNVVAAATPAPKRAPTSKPSASPNGEDK